MDDSSKNKQQSTGPGAAAAEIGVDVGYMLAVRVIRALEDGGFEARLAGGCVRDRLLGLKPHDYDVATTAKPDQVCLIFTQKSIKVVPTGIDHGTVTVVIAGQGIEVTSLRRDVSTDGRRATVEFASKFEDDAERRDFTFNAMYEDWQGRIYDFFGGQADLQQGRLHFVGDAEARIREDYLRILRLFRFWARFDFAPEPETLEACRRQAAGLKIVSQERITHELVTTLDGDHLLAAIQGMYATGILQLVLGVDPDPSLWPRLDALKIGRKTERSAARLALLLKSGLEKIQKADRGSVELILQKLRLAKNFQQIILLHMFIDLTQVDTTPLAAMEAIDQWEQVGGSFLETLLPIWNIMFPEQQAKLLELERIESHTGHRRRAKLPIDGQGLMNHCAIPAGPELGQLLTELKRSWRLNSWQTEQEGLQLARDWWRQRKP